MALKFALYDNPVTPDPNDYMAIVQDPVKRTIDEIVAQMTTPGSILKETECVAVMHRFFKILGENLEKGEGFTSEYLILSPGVNGVFQQDERFTEGKHKRKVDQRLGTYLKESLKRMALEQIPANVPKPVIKTVFDIKSKTLGEQLTPGGMIELKGEKLKIMDTADAQQGVYFIHSSKKTEYKSTYLHINEPKTLSVEVPEGLPRGEYDIEVRTISQNAKNIKKGKFSETLTVG